MKPGRFDIQIADERPTADARWDTSQSHFKNYLRSQNSLTQLAGPISRKSAGQTDTDINEYARQMALQSVQGISPTWSLDCSAQLLLNYVYVYKMIYIADMNRTWKCDKIKINRTKSSDEENHSVRVDPLPLLLSCLTLCNARISKVETVMVSFNVLSRTMLKSVTITEPFYPLVPISHWLFTAWASQNNICPLGFSDQL